MKKRFFVFLTVFLWIVIAAIPCSAYFLDRNESGYLLCFDTDRPAVTPVMDGIISEGEYTQIRYDPENDISVALPDESFLDLVDFGRNTLYMSYDDTYVYVAATTSAKDFHNGCDNNIGNMWGQHCLQLGFADINDDDASMCLEVGYGLSSDTGNLLHRVWNDGQGIGYEDEIVPGQDYIVVKDGGILVYECRVPYEAFCASKPTDCFRFCIVWATGISEDALADQYIHTQLGYGLTGDPGKDVRGFPVIRMSGAFEPFDPFEPFEPFEPAEPAYIHPSYETSPVYETSPAAVTPTMDGIISEGEYTQIRYDPENDISVAVPDEGLIDLIDFDRNTLYMSYDDTYVYVAATTSAENFQNGCDHNIGNMWGQHCLQVGLADINDDDASMRLEIGYGLSSETGNLMHCVWNDGQGIGYEDEIVPGQDYIVVNHGDVLVYESRVPYRAFCASKPTDRFRFCIVWATGISEDALADQYIHTQLAHGITGEWGKDVTGFAVIHMDGQDGPNVNPQPITEMATILKGTPVVDGLYDDIYAPSASFRLRDEDIAAVYDTYGADPCHGAKVNFLYDDEYLYVYIDVADDDVVSAGIEYIENEPNPWQNDCVENWFVLGDYCTKVCIDAYGIKANCIAEGSAGIPVELFDMSESRYTTGLYYGGYVIEAALKPYPEYAALLSSGAEIGYYLQLNDIQDENQETISVSGGQARAAADNRYTLDGLLSERGDVIVRHCTDGADPVLDGVLTPGEWDNAGRIDMKAGNCFAWAGAFSAPVSLRLAWDDKGLWIAADVKDSDVCLAESGSLDGVYSMDAFQIALDPGGLIGERVGGGGMFYSVGPMDDGTLGVCYHPYGGAAEELYDGYEGAYTLTEDGWSFELLIPWGSIEILADDGFAWQHQAGETLNAKVCYLDRNDGGAETNAYTICIEGTDAGMDARDYAHRLVLEGVRGDLNRDGFVDIQDASLLMQHSVFADLYPVSYSGTLDFDGDGAVDIRDVVYLLRYSMYPEDYPIAG